MPSNSKELGIGHLGLTGGGRGSSPLVYIAAGANEVGLWDIQEGKCHQVRCSASRLLLHSHHAHNGANNGKFQLV